MRIISATALDIRSGYTTSTGWLGYDDDKVRRPCREGIAAGWTHFKINVGRDLEDDLRRVAIVRERIGPDRVLMVDANSRARFSCATTS